MSALPRWLALCLLALHGFFLLPGHAFLQSDTQIYVPMLDRIADPTLYARELVAQKQHVSLTLWDEAALLGKRALGVDYESFLLTLHWLSRLAGLYGLFLLGTALGLSEAHAMFLPGIVGLGALVSGPAILTFDYEPVPRGFAAMACMLALGLVSHGRNNPAAVAAAIGFVSHAPACIPLLAPFVFLGIRGRQWRALGIVACAVAVAALSKALQAGSVEQQPFFARVDEQWEALMRMRAPYNWISTWKPHWIQEFLLQGAVAAAALARIWKRVADRRALAYCVAMPLIGLLSIPLAWLFMDQWKWSLMAQVQPARAVMYTVLLSLALSVAAAAHARARVWESALWLLPPFAMLVHRLLLPLPYSTEQWAYIGLLTVAGSLGLCWLPGRQFTAVAVAALSSWVFFVGTRQTNYDASIRHAEIEDVARWARENTPKDAMFQLPELVRSPLSGVFRARAQRALFVDWKIGGQVNYSRALGIEWDRRIKVAGQANPAWREEGVDYLVVKTGTAVKNGVEAYRNARYTVFKIR